MRILASILICLCLGSTAYADQKNDNKRKPSSTKNVRCLLIVDQVTYLNGTCGFESDKAGISITGEKSFAFVSYEGETARGTWNGKDFESKASEELGAMTKSGDCWVNKTATLCAFTNSADSGSQPFPHTYCGTLKDNGDSYQIVDGLYGVYLPADNTQLTDKKGILQRIQGKAKKFFVDQCTCVTGDTESYDRQGEVAYRFKSLTKLFSCKAYIK